MLPGPLYEPYMRTFSDYSIVTTYLSKVRNSIRYIFARLWELEQSENPFEYLSETMISRMAVRVGNRFKPFSLE